ncbi:MAG: Hpt domain-containing protein [Proteobacteria bacterium]|nr:Hpt domain-containing protein [Pseudomonadota bacterium]
MNPIIKEERVMALKKELDGSVFEHLLNIYATELQSLILNLENQLKIQQTQDCIRTAHSIKSISANMGAIQIQVLASEIEKNAREANTNAISQQLVALKALSQGTIIELRKWL